MNSYDSMKKDAGKVVGFFAVAAAIAWVVFYPAMVLQGSTQLKDKKDLSGYWKNFFLAPATWIWFLCVGFLWIGLSASAQGQSITHWYTSGLKNIFEFYTTSH